MYLPFPFCEQRFLEGGDRGYSDFNVNTLLDGETGMGDRRTTPMRTKRFGQEGCGSLEYYSVGVLSRTVHKGPDGEGKVYEGLTRAGGTPSRHSGRDYRGGERRGTRRRTCTTEVGGGG